MDFSALRLWQLISPALPVGAYAYSQGLEYAIDAGWLKTEDDVYQWISGQVTHNLSHLDVPVLKRLYLAWSEDNTNRVEFWTRYLLVSREARELKTEDRQLGMALATLLTNLGISEAEDYCRDREVTFASMLALAATRWEIKSETLAMAYLWMWCENQVAAAIKLVPLGQTSGQKLLQRVAEVIPSAAKKGMSLADDDIGMAAPGVGIASALHEIQYSRLFRS